MRQPFFVQYGLYVVASVMTVVALVGGAISVLMLGAKATDVVVNLSTEFFSIAVTVLIINQLVEARDRQQLKERLVRQMGNSDNGLALQAVAELRAHGWLSDGSLNGVEVRGGDLAGAHLGGANLEGAQLIGCDLSASNLWGANLSNAILEGSRFKRADLTLAHMKEADLIEADLTEAKFNVTNLENADLGSANLEKARVTVEALSQVGCLFDATLPDGSRYPGLYNLEDDIKGAAALGYDTANPKEMAEFYGVTTEEYIRGQDWARTKLKEVRTTGKARFANWVYGDEPRYDDKVVVEALMGPFEAWYQRQGSEDQGKASEQQQPQS